MDTHGRSFHLHPSVIRGYIVGVSNAYLDFLEAFSRVWTLPGSVDLYVAREWLGVDRIPGTVYSGYFLEQLSRGLKARAVHVHAVMDAIRQVQERRPGPTGITRPFKGDDLRGFLYKHWFEARFLPQNLRDHWHPNRKGSLKINSAIRQAYRDAGVRGGEDVTEELAWRISGFISHQLTWSGYQERARQRKLRGERIIFRPDGDNNVFLTLAFHDEPDATVYERMRTHCETEFPEFFRRRL